MKKYITIGIVIIILVASFFAWQWASQPKSEPTIISETKTSKSTTINIPATPPGFNFPESLGKLEVSDYTDMVQERLDKRIKYSAIWTVDSSYTKKWKDMTQKEKQDFKNLRKSTFGSIKKGVEQAGGQIEFKKFKATGMSEKESADLYGGEKIDGEWKITYPENKYVIIWWVKITSAQTSPRISETNYGIPYINVYISHTEF